MCSEAEESGSREVRVSAGASAAGRDAHRPPDARPSGPYLSLLGRPVPTSRCGGLQWGWEAAFLLSPRGLGCCCSGALIGTLWVMVLQLR